MNTDNNIGGCERTARQAEAAVERSLGHFAEHIPQGNRLCRRDMSRVTRADRGASNFSNNPSAGRGKQTKHNKAKDILC